MTIIRLTSAAIAAAAALGAAGIAQAGPALSLSNGEKAQTATETTATPVYHWRRSHYYGYYPGYYGYYPRYYYQPYYYQPYYGYYGYPYSSFGFGFTIR